VRYLLLILLLTGCQPRFQAGFSFVENVPESRLTGHEQFHFAVQGTREISENVRLVGGWQHLSNGAGLGIGRLPNHGIDTFGIDLEWTP